MRSSAAGVWHGPAPRGYVAEPMHVRGGGLKRGLEGAACTPSVLVWSMSHICGAAQSVWLCVQTVCLSECHTPHRKSRRKATSNGLLSHIYACILHSPHPTPLPSTTHLQAQDESAKPSGKAISEPQHVLLKGAVRLPFLGLDTGSVQSVDIIEAALAGMCPGAVRYCTKSRLPCW